ncbi:Sec-independent protein translocase protein TatB [Aureimonas pseudogalii]|uniref:Sec-independent protein translocase protein TatB n=1 Tax=Aureimonas pseudogalii TaxID=1744844 RepID=A0A7W6H5V3_9HYPH|nr:Sec-independent protein translocase protein TatB [Aureimonas pseudogalii]MBB3999128.1 sec-independent protein translocase protein TatB [Aureimonas pseudogalii]
MFDIGGLELLVIAVVLIVVVGPKDLPKMLRTFGRVSTQMRRMAGDFRKQFDEALKEAELDELREVARDVKQLDPRADIRKAMNPVRAVGDEIRSSLKAAASSAAPQVPSASQGPVPVAAAQAQTMSSNPNGAAAPAADVVASSEPKVGEVGPAEKTAAPEPALMNGAATPAASTRDMAGGVS